MRRARGARDSTSTSVKPVGPRQETTVLLRPLIDWQRAAALATQAPAPPLAASVRCASSRPSRDRVRILWRLSLLLQPLTVDFVRAQWRQYVAIDPCTLCSGVRPHLCALPASCVGVCVLTLPCAMLRSSRDVLQPVLARLLTSSCHPSLAWLPRLTPTFRRVLIRC